MRIQLIISALLVVVAGTFLVRIYPIAESYTNLSARSQRVYTDSSGIYNVLELEHFLSPEQCRELIQFASSKPLSTSTVGLSEDAGTYRRSKILWVHDSDLALAGWISDETARLSGYPKQHQELLQVVQYDVNGEFKEHHDACEDVNSSYCSTFNSFSGQRQCTLLIYLNEDMEGGETEFPMLNLKITPRVGKAIFFWNVHADENVIAESLHRGNPVRSGMKWIATKWTHTYPYNHQT